jgi:sodium/bile acid cotransporter 7
MSSTGWTGAHPSFGHNTVDDSVADDGVDAMNFGKSKNLRLLTDVDPFLLLLILCVAAASVAPCRGFGAVVFGWITTAAITTLFFLHGAKLSRAAVWAGVGHWRLHLLVLTSTYLLFPAAGLLIALAGRGWIDPMMSAGMLYLCLLPSTVQSSIAFTSIARGNVPAAVCSATLSNVIGIFLTPLLVGLFLGAIAKGGQSGVDTKAVGSIALQLLLPFVAGHLSRPLTLNMLTRHKTLVSRVDRSSILLVVYTAFSAAVVDGLWRKLSLGDIGLVLVIDAILLASVLIATTAAARLFGFARDDEIAIVFCGSKKSLASGVPMASVLFAPAIGGLIIVPLMLFHQLQLMVCAVLARRYAAETPDTSLRHAVAPVPSR